MTSLYAMQRANGDWFAMSEAGKMCVPVFSCNSDAMNARSQNTEMLHFMPMRLDDNAIEDLRPLTTGEPAGFRIVGDPLLNLSRGRLISHADLILLNQNGHGDSNEGV